jgi:hypothetical protein
MDYFEIGSQELFPWAALSRYPPDRCLLSSWDYRREPRVPGLNVYHAYLKKVRRTVLMAEMVSHRHTGRARLTPQQVSPGFLK